MRRILGAFLLAGLLPASVCLAVFAVPPNDGFVTDAATILTADQESQLEAEITRYRAETSNEIAVVTVKSLDGEPIEDVGLTIGRTWGVGSTKNNGILLLIATDDRQMRFDVGYGLEGAVPDIVAKGIIDTDLTPAFREGRYFDGISTAITSLEKHIGGEYTADRYASIAPSGFSPMLLLFGFLAFQWLLAILGRTKSWWLGGVFGGLGGLVLAGLYGWWLSILPLILVGLFLDFVVSINYHRRGTTRWWAGGGWGPGGGQSGGGFGGFGGGSFGGGGASGKW